MRKFESAFIAAGTILAAVGSDSSLVVIAALVTAIHAVNEGQLL